MLCLRSQPRPHQSMSCSYLKRDDSHWNLPPMRLFRYKVSWSTSSVQALLIEAHWHLFRALLPRWKKLPRDLELKEILYTRNLIMLLSPNFTLSLVFKYFSRLSGFCDNLGSACSALAYWSLCLKYHSSPAPIPSNPYILQDLAEVLFYLESSLVRS